MNALALPLALASIVHLAADVVGRAEVGDRTELRLRWSEPPENPAFDVENIPSIRAELATRRENLALGYSPRFTLRDVNQENGYEIYHEGSLEAGWHSRRTILSLREHGTYGQNNFSSLTLVTNADGSLRIEPVPTGGAVRSCTKFRFASTDTTATLSTIPARSWSWTISPTFSASGGLDDCSQRILAPLKAGGVTTSVEHALSRRTHLSIGAEASDTAFSVIDTTETGTSTGNAEYILVGRFLGLRYAFLPHTEGRLALGAAVLDAQVSGRERDLTPYPTAEGSLTHAFGELADRYTLSATVRLEPLVNRLAAVVDQRIEERLLASRTVGNVALAIAGGATQSIPPDQPSGVSLVTADVTLLYHASHKVDLDVGARYLWQHTNASGPGALVLLTDASYDSKLLYFALVLHDDTLRFLGGSPPPRGAAAAAAPATTPATGTPPAGSPGARPVPGQPPRPRTDESDQPEGPPEFNPDPHPPPPLP